MCWGEMLVEAAADYSDEMPTFEVAILAVA